MMRKVALISTVLLLLTMSAPAQEPAISVSSRTADIAAYAEQVRQQWKIPGMSLAVIHGDSTVLVQGFGVKEKGGNDPVTPSTLFHIGSMTKAFTATVIASLVDEGLLSWDDTVKDILPDFDWYDDSVENAMQVRDLLTHSTGLVAQAGTYIPNLGYNRDDIYRMFRYIEPVYPFREKFAYNNITFIIAARIIETVTSKSWEDNIRERIFNPLDMSSSVPGSDGYRAAGKKASTAHYFGYNKGSIYVTPLYGEERALHWVDVIGPAGSISSTAEDMAKWVRFHLDNGKVARLITPDSSWHSSFPADINALSAYFPENGCSEAAEFRFYPYHDTVRLISGKQMDFLHTGAVHVRTDTTMTRDYGYCWYVEHNDVCGFVPGLDLGIALLCNSEVSEYARLGLMRYIIDLYLQDGIVRDWSTEGLEQWFADRQKPRRRAVPCTIKRDSRTPDPARLVGLYTKPEPFGNAEVTLKNGRLYLTIGRYGWLRRPHLPCLLPQLQRRGQRPRGFRDRLQLQRELRSLAPTAPAMIITPAGSSPEPDRRFGSSGASLEKSSLIHSNLQNTLHIWSVSNRVKCASF